MEHAEDQTAKSCLRADTAGGQLRGGPCLRRSAKRLPRQEHQNDRDRKLVGREGKEEADQDRTVHAEQLPCPVQRPRKLLQEAHAADLHRAQHPQDQPRRSRHQRRTGEHMQRLAEDRVGQDLFWLRTPVGRQLEHEGRRRLPVQQLTQQEGHRERPACPQADRRRQQQGQQQIVFPAEQDRPHRQQHGKAAVAGDHGVRADGNELFLPRRHDPAARHADSVAAEPHAHGQRLPPGGPAALEQVIRQEGGAGQIADVLQHGKEAEKDGGRRQHDGRDPRRGRVDAVPDGVRQQRRPRAADAQKQCLQPVKAALQPVGAAVAAHQRQPKQDDQQCGKNHGPRAFARQNGVQPRVTPGLAAGDGLRGELPGIADAVRGLLTVWQMRTDGHEAIQHVADRLPQAGDRIRVARARADDRDAKEGLQRVQVDADPLLFGLIHQIDADDHARPALHQLDGKRQAPRQTGRVADGDQTGVRMRAQVVRCDMLLLRAGREGIGPRQVGDYVARSGVGVFSLRDRDGLARPVAGMLVQARQGVKKTALADVRVPGQRDGAGRGIRTAHETASTSRRAASFRRRAKTAPLTA